MGTAYNRQPYNRPLIIDTLVKDTPIIDIPIIIAFGPIGAPFNVDIPYNRHVIILDTIML